MDLDLQDVCRWLDVATVVFVIWWTSKEKTMHEANEDCCKNPSAAKEPGPNAATQSLQAVKEKGFFARVMGSTGQGGPEAAALGTDVPAYILRMQVELHGIHDNIKKLTTFMRDGRAKDLPENEFVAMAEQLINMYKYAGSLGRRLMLARIRERQKANPEPDCKSQSNAAGVSG